MENKALEELLDKASQGDAKAQCYLGDYYEDHDNVKSSYWFAKAAEQDCLEAIYSLADHYLEGKGIEKDEAKALALYRRCVEFQDVNNSDTDLAFSASKDIAQFYEQGLVVDKDIPAAIACYKQAAAGNVLNPEDYETIASYYESNEYGQQDYNEAVRWYERARNYSQIIKICQTNLKDEVRRTYYQIKEKRRHHCYSDFLLQCDIEYHDIERQYRDYYKRQFARDLQSYYQLKPSGTEPRITFSPSCQPMHRKTARLMGSRLVEYHFFSIATYFTSLFPQVLGKTLGKKYADQFFVATGWPCLYCGMGGWMSPIDIINDSDLRPSEEYIEDYLFIFTKVQSSMVDEFLAFLKGGQSSLNAPAYESLINKIQAQPDNLSLIKNECKFQCELFKNWIYNPTTPHESMLVPYDTPTSEE